MTPVDDEIRLIVRGEESGGGEFEATKNGWPLSMCSEKKATGARFVARVQSLCTACYEMDWYKG